MMKEKKSEIESDNQLWTSNASFVALLSENKVTFLLKIILINDEPLLRGHLPVLRGWPLNEGTV